MINLNNFVINTNVDAIQHSEGRRYYIADISTKRIQDYVYFGKIKDECYNDAVGEAFYNYLLTIDTTDFNSQKFPETEAKKNAVCDLLSLEFKFLKESFVLKNKAVGKMKVNDLYKLYVDYCIGVDKKALNNIKFCAKLKEINIHFSKIHGYNYYNIDLERLRGIADKFKWIHELDEFEEQEDKPKDEDNGLDHGINKDLEEAIKKQSHEIEQLKKQIELLTKNSTDEAEKEGNYIINLIKNRNQQLNQTKSQKMRLMKLLILSIILC